MEELKPCPFCGARAHMWQTNYATYIECESYDPKYHQVQISENNNQNAIRKWNKRAGHIATEKINEALCMLENLKWLKGYDNTTVNGKPVSEILDMIAKMIES